MPGLKNLAGTAAAKNIAKEAGKGLAMGLAVATAYRVFISGPADAQIIQYYKDHPCKDNK
eukprot:CAMPEP_0174955958 /NCGR_PEP_ID=MMETSP0004_2-20121128/1266_1 /TAXON_ID=420556 /ORGANISM="Ochromonas sp., Strain CCMP1393" /LENGTH=59 /DNA_ID=CAMNT_0016203935 /DNA_START=45 /DNA_END=224 /DNA_ORIENTATION=-